MLQFMGLQRVGPDLVTEQQQWIEKGQPQCCTKGIERGIFLTMPHARWDLSSPTRELNLCPLHEVLTTGLPGNSERGNLDGGEGMGKERTKSSPPEE